MTFLDLSELPQGQRRAIEALIGDGVDQTYTQAAKIAGMAEGTLLYPEEGFVVEAAQKARTLRARERWWRS